MCDEVLSKLKGGLSLQKKFLIGSLVLFFFIPNYWFVNRMPPLAWSTFFIFGVLWSFYFGDFYILSFYFFHLNLVLSSLIFGLLYHYSKKFKLMINELFSSRLIYFFFNNPFSKAAKKAGEVVVGGSFLKQPFRCTIKIMP